MRPVAAGNTASSAQVLHQAKLGRWRRARWVSAAVIAGAWAWALATGNLEPFALIMVTVVIWMRDAVNNWRASWARPQSVVALGVCAGSLAVGDVASAIRGRAVCSTCSPP